MIQKIPNFFYGTAWKEEKTADLTFQALVAGFTAIDTANQRKHYFEEAVGHGIRKFLELKTKKREDLFLQTKFTFARGQDHRKPYIESDPFPEQVVSSFASSLQHLQTDYLDSYILHGPYGAGIGKEDLVCWNKMEEFLVAKKTKYLGISNVNAEQLETLCNNVTHKPKFVQNRCYANQGWDFDVRKICENENIMYQGFSLLTANRQELQGPLVASLAKKYNKLDAQIIFRFCHQLGMICLTGTTNQGRMKLDLSIEDFELTSTEVSMLENVRRT